jgi:Ca-activated chloride channel family protein
VGALTRLGESLVNDLSTWRRLALADLRYAHLDAVRLITVGFVGLALAVLIARASGGRRAASNHVAMPALLGWSRESALSWFRHFPTLLFVLGLPFFGIALAQPYTALSRSEVSFPGRRIGIIIDASASMNMKFYTNQLRFNGQEENAFFTTVGAAQFFVHERMKGRYRDLISLVEFGDEAYVVTPFTNDYDNVLLSLALIGDPTEFKAFPDKGTTIALAIQECVNLFRSFQFLDAAGNVMVVFSDGQDTQTMLGRQKVSDILKEAVDAKVPVYFIRTNYDKGQGEVVADGTWAPAVASTGGRFYAASDEATIIKAIHEIDQAATGRIETKQYSAEIPLFAPFSVIAAAFWAVGLLLKLSVPFFTKFP